MLLIVYNIFWSFVVRCLFIFALFIVLFLFIYWFRWIFEILELWCLYPLIEARLWCWQEQALSSSLWHQHQWCSRYNNPPWGTKESPRDTPSNMAGGMEGMTGGRVLDDWRRGCDWPRAAPPRGGNGSMMIVNTSFIKILCPARCSWLWRTFLILFPTWFFFFEW